MVTRLCCFVLTLHLLLLLPLRLLRRQFECRRAARYCHVAANMLAAIMSLSRGHWLSATVAGVFITLALSSYHSRTATVCTIVSGLAAVSAITAFLHAGCPVVGEGEKLALATW